MMESYLEHSQTQSEGVTLHIRTGVQGWKKEPPGLLSRGWGWRWRW